MAENDTKTTAIIHEAEEGGYWAEAPAIAGRASEGETMDELVANRREAIGGCMSIDVAPLGAAGTGRILEVAI